MLPSSRTAKRFVSYESLTCVQYTSKHTTPLGLKSVQRFAAFAPLSTVADLLRRERIKLKMVISASEAKSKNCSAGAIIKIP